MPELHSDEVLIRALPSMLWDEKEGRAVSHAFMHLEISVSRPSILPFPEIAQIFQLDVAKPGERVEHAALITVKVLADVVQSHESKRGMMVVEDPIKDDPELEDNPSHALIKGYVDVTLAVQKEFSKGLARSIIKKVEYHTLPAAAES